MIRKKPLLFSENADLDSNDSRTLSSALARDRTPHVRHGMMMDRTIA